MLKFLSLPNCLPCSRSTTGVIHPTTKNEIVIWRCKECHQDFRSKHSEEQTDLCLHCLSAKQESNIVSPDQNSNGSLEDQGYVETKKGASSLFDRNLFRKSRVFDKSPKSTGKSLVIDPSFNMLSFADKSDRIVERPSPKSFILDERIDTSSKDDNLEKIANLVRNQPLHIRIQMESKFLKTNMEKRAFKKFLISEDWMIGYKQFLDGETQEIPGPIDNRSLSKRISKKMNSGSIFAVNERLWRFLVLLYEGGPDIPYYNEPVKSRSFHVRKLEVVREFEPYSADATQSKKNLFLSSPKIILSDINYSLAPIKMIYDKFSSCIAPCFQILLGITDLLKFFEEEKYIDILNFKNPTFWKVFQDIIDINLRNNSQVIISTFKKVLKGWFQSLSIMNDACGFIEYFLYGLQKEASSDSPTFDLKSGDFSQLTRSNSYLSSGIHELFGGIIIDCTKCLKCKKKSVINRNYQVLTLPVVPDKTRTIDDCITLFQKQEDVSELLTCNWCKEESKHIKRSVVYKYPKYLFLRLDRFSQGNEAKKISDFVNYLSEDWRIKGKGDSETNNYSLIGVITHNGTATEGVYNCYTKRGDKWFFCEDGEVKKVFVKSTIQQDAYMLLYQRRS